MDILDKMKKRIVKTISIFLILTLILQDIVWANPCTSYLAPDQNPEDSDVVARFEREYGGRTFTDEDRGRVEERRLGIADPRTRDVFGEIFGIDLSKVPRNPEMGINVKEIILDVARKLLQHPDLKGEIERIYVFGSVAKGTANRSTDRGEKDYPSDIDLFVRFKGLPETGGREMMPQDESVYRRINRLKDSIGVINERYIRGDDIRIDIYSNAVFHPDIDVGGGSAIEWDIAGSFEDDIADKKDRILIWSAGEGYIWQGTEAKKEFEARREEIERNDITGKYKDRLIELIEGEGLLRSLSSLAMTVKSEDFKIYAFQSIVKGKDDFFLGYREENKLYLALDLIALLDARGPPSLVDEYLLHEVLCPILGHKEAIRVQQKIFENENYPDKEALSRQIEDKPYKGLLGKALRSLIDFESLTYRSLEYGLQRGVIKRDRRRTYDILVQIFMENRIEPQTAKRIAETLVKMNRGSLEILRAFCVITGEGRDIIVEGNAEALRNFGDDKKRDLSQRFKNLVNSYDRRQRKRMMKRLAPVEVIDYLSVRYDVFKATVLQIIDQHPDFPVWFPIAEKKVREIEATVGGRGNAWIIVKQYGLGEGLDSWIRRAEAVVRELQGIEGGMSNAWNYVARHGLGNGRENGGGNGNDVVEIAVRKGSSSENIGKNVEFRRYGDKLIIKTRYGEEIVDIEAENDHDRVFNFIKEMVRDLAVYREFGEEFVSVFNNIKLELFYGTEHARMAGAFAHMSDSGIIYVDAETPCIDIAIIHEAIHKFLKDRYGDSTSALRELINNSAMNKRLKARALEKAGDDPVKLRHYYARYYLQNLPGGKYKGSLNENLTRGIRSEIAKPGRLKGKDEVARDIQEAIRRVKASGIEYEEPVILFGNIADGAVLGDVRGIFISIPVYNKKQIQKRERFKDALWNELSKIDRTYDTKVYILDQLALSEFQEGRESLLLGDQEQNYVVVITGGWIRVVNIREPEEDYNEQKVEEIAKKLKIKKGILRMLLDNLSDEGRSKEMGKILLKFLKEDEEITEDELNMLVDYIEKAIQVLYGISAFIDTEDERKELIKRIALYLSIMHIKRSKEAERMPLCMRELADSLHINSDYKTEALKIVSGLRIKDTRMADVFLRKVSEVFGNDIVRSRIEEVRRYLYLRARISEALRGSMVRGGISRNGKSPDADLVTRYLLEGESFIKDKKTKESIKQIVSIKQLERIRDSLAVPVMDVRGLSSVLPKTAPFVGQYKDALDDAGRLIGGSA